MIKGKPKTQKSHFTLTLFLFLLWSFFIIFIRSESFLRWFDDPKDVVFYLGLLGLLLWQWRELQKKQKEISSISLVTFLVVIFLFYLPINIFFTHPAINEALAVVGKYALFVAGVAVLSERDLDFNLKWIKNTCLILILAVLCSFYFRRDDSFIEPFGFASYYADTLALAFPLIVYFCFKSESRMGKIIFGVAAVLFIFGIMMSTKKSGLMILYADVLILVILGSFFFKGKLRWGFIGLGIVLPLVTVLILFLLQHLSSFGGQVPLPKRLEFLFTEIQSGAWQNNARLVFIQRSWEAVQQNPLMGLGYGSFRFLYPKFYQLGDVEPHFFNPQNSQWLMHPHNEIMYQLFEGGWIGLILLGAIFLMVMGCLIKKIKNGSDDHKALALVTFLGLASAFVIGLVNTSLTHPLIRFFLLLYLALAFCLARDILSQYTIPKFRNFRWVRQVGFLFLTIFILSSGFVAVGYSASSYFLKTEAIEMSGILTPRSYDYLIRAAHDSLKQGDLNHTKNIWATAYHEFPFLPQTMLEYAKVLTRLNDIDQAHTVLQKGHELYPFYVPLEKFYQKIVKRLEMESKRNSQ